VRKVYATIRNVCHNCDAEFYRDSHRKYCCWDCFRKQQSFGGKKGTASNKWKGGIPQWVCANCGVIFQAYCTEGGKPRKFCRWQCANTFNAGKHGTFRPSGDDFDMRTRVRYENELFDILERRGYRCVRSAGSRGAADLIAFNDKICRVIQVKTTYNFDRKGNESVFYHAAKELRNLPCPNFCVQELWVRVLQAGWQYVVLNDLPTEDAEFRRSLKTADWIYF